MADGKISQRLLDEFLGKEQTKNPQTNRKVQKQSVVKRGRKDAGPKNPRGTPTGRSLEEQLRGKVGELGERNYTMPNDIAGQVLKQLGVEDPRYAEGSIENNPEAGMFAEMGPRLAESERFKSAVEQYIQEFGTEPATDSDFDVVIDMMMAQPGFDRQQAPKMQQQILEQMGESEEE